MKWKDLKLGKQSLHALREPVAKYSSISVSAASG